MIPHGQQELDGCHSTYNLPSQSPQLIQSILTKLSTSVVIQAHYSRHSSLYLFTISQAENTTEKDTIYKKFGVISNNPSLKS